MPQSNHLALRVLLWVIGLYHVVCGLLANLMPDRIPALAQMLAGMKVTASPDFLYLAKPFGVYVIAFGIMMIVAAWNPVKNRALISIGILLFALRIFQRLTTMTEVETLFGVTPARSLATIGIVACFGGALAWLRFQLYRQMHTGDAGKAT